MMYTKIHEKIIHIVISILIQAAFCVLNFMLPAYIPNFTKLSVPHGFSRHDLMVSMQFLPVLYIFLPYVISFQLI